MNKKEYRTNHNLFNKWNEFSSYIFGFWLSDGCIYLKPKNKKYYKQFLLFNTDKQIMEELSIILKKSIQIKKPRKEKYKVQYWITIHSDKLFDFCYSITGSTTKSNKEIQLPKIPNKYFHHFIRGFFDGDGSIFVKRYKTRHGKSIEALQTSFTAGKDTGNFIENLKQKLRKFIPVGNKKICGIDSKTLIFNQYDSMLLCEWMYKDATIYMKRKKDIWDSMDKEKLKNSVKYFSNKV